MICLKCLQKVKIYIILQILETTKFKMNSALLKEREELRKRAMAVPVVENKKRKVEEPAKPSKPSKPPSSEKVL